MFCLSGRSFRSWVKLMRPGTQRSRRVWLTSTSRWWESRLFQLFLLPLSLRWWTHCCGPMFPPLPAHTHTHTNGSMTDLNRTGLVKIVFSQYPFQYGPSNYVVCVTRAAQYSLAPFGSVMWKWHHAHNPSPTHCCIFQAEGTKLQKDLRAYLAAVKSKKHVFLCVCVCF